MKFETTLLRNNVELQKRKFGRNNDAPDRDKITARRDYLIYRLGASFSQLAMLRKTITDSKRNYDSLIPRQVERVEFILRSQNFVTYCLDNMVFNLASMSDYFGNYMGLYFYGPNFQNLKWSGFVNKTNEVYRNSDFGNIIAKEHREWFDKVHSFRGDIIHRKVLKAEVDGFEFTYFNPQEVPRLNFSISGELKKYFHIFREGEDDDLYRCAEKISNRTLKGMIDIMESSERVTFDMKHHWTRNM